MQMNKKHMALVLAGGGSLGSYQVGAIEALEELGYTFDIVTGTSIGALNGSFVCNHQTHRLRELWEGITPDQVMKDGMNLSVREASKATASTFNRSLRKWANVYLQGGKPGADITPLKQFVAKHLDVKACMQSDVRYGIVSTLFPSYKLVDIDMNRVSEEDFLPYLFCSTACFPIFPVEVVHKVKYIDGFYNDNLPIRLAFQYGADEVIAIDMRLFQLKPQHDFYLKLPNVTYIAPYIDFGSLMDFSQEVIRPNMRLGYYDVMKHFKRYLGYTFTFNDKIDVKGFLSYILSTYGVDSKYILAAITKDIRTPMDETDYFVRTLELIAIRLGINEYYRTFTFKEFISLIKNKSVIANVTAGFSGVSLNKMLKNLRKNLELHRADRVVNRFLREFSQKYLSVEFEENRFINYEETKYLDYVEKKDK